MAAERHAIERRVTLNSKYSHWEFRIDHKCKQRQRN